MNASDRILDVSIVDNEPKARVGDEKTSLRFVADRLGGPYARALLNVGALPRIGTLKLNRAANTATLTAKVGFELRLNGTPVPAVVLHYSRSGDDNPKWEFIGLSKPDDSVCVPESAEAGNGDAAMEVKLPSKTDAPIPATTPPLMPSHPDGASGNPLLTAASSAEAKIQLPKGAGVTVNLFTDAHNMLTAEVAMGKDRLSQGIARLLRRANTTEPIPLSISGVAVLSVSNHEDADGAFWIIRPLERNLLTLRSATAAAVRVRLNDANRAKELVVTSSNVITAK